MPPSRSTSILSPAPIPACRVAFGETFTGVREMSGQPTLRIPLPVLSGAETENVLRGATATDVREGCTIFEKEDRVAGFTFSAAGDLESAAQNAYERVFAATKGRHLYRVWNYVPRINEIEGGLENYRRFCRGRSHAFEKHFGEAFQRQLPAASAVGTAQGNLAIAFIAGDAAPRHFENPRQVPAFEYPPAYGPRPPSFSRATSVDTDARREIYVSGTAAIRGHVTIAGQDLAGQLACTRENLEVIGRIAGAGDDFGAADGWQRTLKIYVRHAGDFGRVREDLERNLLTADDTVTYLQADLCRSDLLVEIEAVLTAESDV